MLTEAFGDIRYGALVGLVAQLVEQKTFNLLVPGSSPGGLTIQNPGIVRGFLFSVCAG